jgi:hypothetical protein
MLFQAIHDIIGPMPRRTCPKSQNHGPRLSAADQICDGSFVASAAMLLKNCDGVGSPRNMVSFIDLAPSSPFSPAIIINLHLIARLYCTPFHAVRRRYASRNIGSR